MLNKVIYRNKNFIIKGEGVVLLEGDVTQLYLEPFSKHIEELFDTFISNHLDSIDEFSNVILKSDFECLTKREQRKQVKRLILKVHNLFEEYTRFNHFKNKFLYSNENGCLIDNTYYPLIRLESFVFNYFDTNKIDNKPSVDNLQYFNLNNQQLYKKDIERIVGDTIAKLYLDKKTLTSNSIKENLNLDLNQFNLTIRNIVENKNTSLIL